MPKLGTLKNEELIIEGPVDTEPTLQTFEAATQIEPEPVQQQIEVSDTEARELERDNQLVEVRVRENLTRTRIVGTWYSFQKNKPQMVPRFVKRWLDERGLL